jgi:hypothetical protein
MVSVSVPSAVALSAGTGSMEISANDDDDVCLLSDTSEGTLEGSLGSTLGSKLGSTLGSKLKKIMTITLNFLTIGR